MMMLHLAGGFALVACCSQASIASLLLRRLATASTIACYACGLSMCRIRVPASHKVGSRTVRAAMRSGRCQLVCRSALKRALRNMWLSASCEIRNWIYEGVLIGADGPPRLPDVRLLNQCVISQSAGILLQKIAYTIGLYCTPRMGER